jgi:hypothetical protein
MFVFFWLKAKAPVPFALLFGAVQIEGPWNCSAVDAAAVAASPACGALWQTAAQETAAQGFPSGRAALWRNLFSAVQCFAPASVGAWKACDLL